MRANPRAGAETRCLCATVRRAARLLNRRYEEALEPAGLTPGQFELMMVLRHTGPVDQARLWALLEVDQTTLSRNLRPLVRERWVVEERPEDDRRRRVYGLTELGARVLAEAQRLWRDVHVEMERAIGEPMAAFWPMLDRLLAAARGDAEKVVAG